MSYSLNRCCFFGYVGRDPEIRQTGAGASVANFSIACDEVWTDDRGEQQKKTEWVRFVAWRKQADLVGRLVKKGRRVYAEGRMQTRSWEKDGQKHYATEILLDKLILAGDRAPEGAPAASAAADPWDDVRDLAASRQPAGHTEDDLPF